MANVLVIGASRGIGLETVKQALGAGHSVRAMARSASSIRVRNDRLDVFAGDALDETSVRHALDGIDTVVQALGIPAGPRMMLEPVRLFSESTWTLVPAMEDLGVKRLICVTGFGAGNSRNRGNPLYNAAFTVFLSRAYDDKDVQERIIQHSRLDWIIARPGVLTNGPKTGRYRVLVDPKRWKAGCISRADVADFLVKQIESDEYLRDTPVLIN